MALSVKPSILIADDERNTRDGLARALSHNYITYGASNGLEAMEILRENRDIEVVLSDLKMPEMEGLELLENLLSENSNLIVIFITGYSSIESAVDAMRKGAYDYLTKPIDLNKLEIIISKALENKKLRAENIQLKERIKEKFDTKAFIGKSLKIIEIFELVKHVSSTTATVLIQGETGTGKELIASIIHYNSPVAEGPFIKVNCSALVESLLESELFGHEKGAFTGALYSKKGRFELADGGTLFLDEISDLPASVQIKLLRFLQEGEFERVGGTKTLKVNVRIISASNKSLEELVKDDKFRLDLFYRLKVVTIDMPALNERKEDIPLIVDHYLKKFAEIHNKDITGITREAMSAVKAYNWPGNVRELMNCIECAVVMSRESVVNADNLPPFLSSDLSRQLSGGKYPRKLSDVEKSAILETLDIVGGNKAEASRILGIGLRTLYRKLEQYERDLELKK